MKQLLATILLSLSLTTTAQQNIPFYPEMCDILQQVFCDYTKAEAETKYISSRHGHLPSILFLCLRCAVSSEQKHCSYRRWQVLLKFLLPFQAYNP